VTCYLCAYGRSEAPNDHQALPAGSSVGPHEDLATCDWCGVWACSAHGTRYAQFECAICTPAKAVQDAMAVNAVGTPAAAVAHLVGVGAHRRLWDRAGEAMRRIFRASQAGPQRVDGRSLVAPRRGQPNLVTDLADVIRGQEGWIDEDFVHAGRADGRPYGRVYIDAIGGAVRDRFGNRQPAEPDDASITTATGALLLGYSLAEPDIAARRRDDPFRWPEAIDELRRPWEVANPIFLDPALWMLGTALQAN
jgi:hypothetical protein